MAERQTMLKMYRTFAASAAVLMLVAFTVPAIASHEVAPGLADKNEALVKLEREADSPAPFLAPKVLAPRAEAAIREAFKAASVPPLAKTKSSADASSVDHSQTETPLGMNTRLPGVSEKDMLLYKKQMYRKDI